MKIAGAALPENAPRRTARTITQATLPEGERRAAAELHDYAMVIGIDDYEHPSLQLGGAGRDARAFIKWLEAPSSDGTFDSSRIIKRVPKADYSDVYRAFNELIDKVKEVQGTGRRLYIFVAGHGSGRKIGNAFFYSSEHRPDSNGGGIDVVDAAMKLGAMFQEIVMFVDCCRSFTADMPMPIPMDLPIKAENNRPLQVHFHCFACRINEVTEERRMKGGVRGVFSSHLLKALRGDAAGAVDHLGQVTAFSLTRYLAKLQIGAKADHDPRDEAELRSIVLAKGFPPRTYPLEIRLEKPTSIGLINGNNYEPLDWKCVETAKGTYRVERQEEWAIIVTSPKVKRVEDAKKYAVVLPKDSRIEL